MVDLVSLVSVSCWNLTQTVETVEASARLEFIEVVSVYAGPRHLAENTTGWRKRQGEYPTLSAISVSH